MIVLKAKWFVIWTIIFISLFIGAMTKWARTAVPKSELNKEKQVNFTASNLPIIVIDTQGKRIRNSSRIIVDMGIIYNGTDQINHLEDPFNNYQGKISIEIRGSSGQWQNWPKEQYAFETQDSLGNNRNVALIDLPEENDWILYPPYSDKSLLRNVLAYQLSNDVGRYAPRTRFCELVLNDDYRGVYVLIEKIKRDKNRVDISKLKSTDIEGDQITGGYIIKVDRPAGEDNDGWDSRVQLTERKVSYLYHDPKPSELVDEQKKYIRNFVNEFEWLMTQPNWAANYQDYFNLDAFVDYYLINELPKNVDVYTFSTFIYKDRDSKDRRLTMGPVWDFNLAFGNVNYFEGALTTGWLLGRKIQVNDRIPFWFRNLYQDSEIQRLIASRWQQLRQTSLALERIIQLIDDWVTKLDAAQKRNFERWPILGNYVWPNHFIGCTYAEEIEYLKEWLTERIQWMDEQLVTGSKVPDKLEPVLNFSVGQNYPNPFNNQTVIPFQLHHAGNIRIRIFDALGRQVQELFTGTKTVGWHTLVYQPQQSAGGPYFYQIEGESGSISKPMLLVK